MNNATQQATQRPGRCNELQDQLLSLCMDVYKDFTYLLEPDEVTRVDFDLTVRRYIRFRRQFIAVYSTFIGWEHAEIEARSIHEEVYQQMSDEVNAKFEFLDDDEEDFNLDEPGFVDNEDDDDYEPDFVNNEDDENIYVYDTLEF